MKKTLQSVITISLISLGLSVDAQDRYLDDVFSAVTVTSDVTYGTNISILPMLQTLPPGPTTLNCDIYEPTGDTETNRPVIILAHTGSFLPPVINGQATGSKSDLSIVEQCTRWARKGYVAIAMDNRLGWNPTSSDQNVRTSSLLQAAYRGIQDAKALVRYIRKTEATGNPYGVDESKIVLGGQGTGAYIALGYPTLDNPNVELNLLKFLDLTDPQNPVPYVVPTFFGNPDGTDSTYLPDFASPTGQTELWNIPNNLGYSNEINMAFNLGGAIADISWLESGDVPIVSFHCEKDPYAPLDTGDVIVPTTGDFVVEVMGSRTVQIMQNMYGNNSSAWSSISDNITTTANINNNGNDGLYIFKTPAPSINPNAFGQFDEDQGSPWDWWDNVTYGIQAEAINGIPGQTSAAFFEANAILGNPNMSETNGNLYLDTIQGYLNPRMYLTLGLGASLSINELIAKTTEIYPNPANNFLNIVSYTVGIEKINIYNMKGQIVLNKEVNNNQKSINISSLKTGIYLVDILSENTSVKRKLIIE